MMASAAFTRQPGSHPVSVDPANWGARRLSALVAATADRHPRRIAFRDQNGRERWSGRPPIEWTYRLACDVVDRLAAFFGRLPLPPGSPIGICLPNGSEACLSILAVEQAGFVPCLLPIGWDEAELAEALENAGVDAVVTLGTVGAERPAQSFGRMARRRSGPLLVCAFGPYLPDGTADLDRIIVTDQADCGAHEPGAGRETGIVTFSRRTGAIRPVFRTTRSVVAAGLSFLATTRIGGGERILTLLPPDDHRGLVTGLIAAILTGATLDCHGLFDSASLLEDLARGAPAHLVAPGWLEERFAETDLPREPASFVLVHEAPVRFRSTTDLKRTAIDVVSFDEMAVVVAGGRDRQGQFALGPDGAGVDGGEAGARLLRMRRDPDGSIAFRGFAVDARSFGSEVVAGEQHASEWLSSGFSIELADGQVVGVR